MLAPPPLRTEIDNKSQPWQAWFSDIRSDVNSLQRDIIYNTHNNLLGLQGGITTERYHLTSLQYSNLHVPASVLDTSSISFTINGQEISASVIPGGVDHNSLANLTVGNPHTQYAHAFLGSPYRVSRFDVSGITIEDSPIYTDAANTMVGINGVPTGANLVSFSGNAYRAVAPQDYDANPYTQILFDGKYNVGGNIIGFATIGAGKTNATNNNSSGFLSFATRSNAGTLAERMRLFDSGNLSIGDSTDYGFKLDSHAASRVRGIRGTATASGATQTNLAWRIGNLSDDLCIDFGVAQAGQNEGTTWMQSTHSSDLSQNTSLAINPLGGEVTINANTFVSGTYSLYVVGKEYVSSALRIGLNNVTYTTEEMLDVVSDSSAQIRQVQYGGAGPGNIVGGAIGGAPLNPTDELTYGAAFIGQGYRSGRANLGSIKIYGGGAAASGGGVRGKILFDTTNNDSTSTTKAEISIAGNLLINTSFDTNRLEVGGNGRFYREDTFAGGVIDDPMLVLSHYFAGDSNTNAKIQFNIETATCGGGANETGDFGLYSYEDYTTGRTPRFFVSKALNAYDGIYFKNPSGTFTAAYDKEYIKSAASGMLDLYAATNIRLNKTTKLLGAGSKLFIPTTTGTNAEGLFLTHDATLTGNGGVLQGGDTGTLSFLYFATNRYYNGTSWASLNAARVGGLFYFQNGDFYIQRSAASSTAWTSSFSISGTDGTIDIPALNQKITIGSVGAKASIYYSSTSGLVLDCNHVGTGGTCSILNGNVGVNFTALGTTPAKMVIQTTSTGTQWQALCLDDSLAYNASPAEYLVGRSQFANGSTATIGMWAIGGGKFNTTNNDKTGWMTLYVTNAAGTYGEVLKLYATKDVKMVNNGAKFYQGASDQYNFTFNGTNAVHTLTSGNMIFDLGGNLLGIGTGASVYEFLHLTFQNASSNIHGLFVQNNHNSSGENASVIFSNDSGGRRKAAISYVCTGAYGSGDFVWSLSPADSTEVSISAHEKMRLTLDGNLGINCSPSARLQVVGDTRFGGATDYTGTEADGTLVFNGAATVWRDIFFPMSPPKSTGAGNPTLTTWNTVFRNYAFAVNDVHDFDPQEFDHMGKINTATAQWHVHFVSLTNVAAARTIKWEITYSQIGANGDFAAGTTINAEYTVPANTPVGRHILFDVGSAFTTLTPGSMMVVRLKRIASSGTEPASDPIVLALHYHYEVDTCGSRSITTK